MQPRCCRLSGATLGLPTVRADCHGGLWRRADVGVCDRQVGLISPSHRGEIGGEQCGNWAHAGGEAVPGSGDADVE
jgi:hypothetical protein